MMSEITSTSEGAVHGELFCFSALFPDPEDIFHEDPLQAYKATTNPDIMYYHETMKERDRMDFILAMEQEMDQNFEENSFEVVPRSYIPKDATVLPYILQLRRKRLIKTGKVKKYKSRINVDGSHMIHGEHYDFTYSPVAPWSTIRLI